MAGMYVRERFDRQYLLLPQTVGDSFGSVFVEDLQKAVDRLYPEGGGYRPEVIYYPDRGFRSYIEQGKVILKTVEENEVQPGYAVVMLNPTSTLPRQHDPLAALVIRNLKDFDLLQQRFTQQWERIAMSNGTIKMDNLSMLLVLRRMESCRVIFAMLL